MRGHSKKHEFDLATLTDQHRYEYIAYDVAWRIVMGFDPRGGHDADQRWRNSELIRIATNWQRKKRGLPPAYVSPPMPADQRAVRPNWRQLLPRDLTEAERELAQQARDETMRRYRSERGAREAEALAQMIGDPFKTPPAPEIPPPVYQEEPP